MNAEPIPSSRIQPRPTLESRARIVPHLRWPTLALPLLRASAPLREQCHLSLLLGALLLVSPFTSLPAADNLSSAQRITRARVFFQPIIWTSPAEPTEAESIGLWQAITRLRTDGIEAGLATLEQFISDNPDSPWTPSLQANLGKYYLDRGRYTPALRHWEAAWLATKDAKAGAAKGVADFTLAHWTRLVAGLGRRDTLAVLLVEAEGRVIQSQQLRQMLNATREHQRRMANDHDIGTGCGAVALASMAQALQKTDFNFRGVLSRPTPPMGYSLSSLRDLAGQEGLNVLPVKRLRGSELVVPSIVHWRQNHYAAIVAKKGGLYQVVDPIFDRPRWMTAKAIDAEASGNFLVPHDKVLDGWQRLATTDTDRIFGKGYPNRKPPPPPPCNPPPGVCCPPSSGPPSLLSAKSTACSSCGSAGGGGLSAPSSGSFSGMPSWWVMEPDINLQMRDEPLGYQPARGPRVSFLLTYSQREPRPQSTNIFNFGPLWNCDWLSYMAVSYSEEDPNFANYWATLYYPGGGRELTFSYSDETPEYYTRTKMDRLVDESENLLGFRLLNADGSSATYGYLQTNAFGDLTVFVSSRTDASGQSTVTFNYEETNGITRLIAVVDASGQTNTLRYSTNFPAQVEEVEDPFGRKATLRYDNAGNLTNLTDVINLSSSFLYDTNGWITNLTTPYGATTFEHTGGTGDYMGGYDTINRSVTVTLPNGGKEFYAYRDDCRSLLPQFSSNVDAPASFYAMLETNVFPFRNSFYWGPRQYAALSTTNSSNFTTNDYRLSRLRHWLHTPVGGMAVGNTLSWERSPSSTGTTDGPITWYGYAGKGYYYLDGTNQYPSLVALVLPDGTTQYTQTDYNQWLKPTQVISTYSVGGAVYTRTNTYEYAANGIDLIKHIGPTGIVEDGYSYNTNHQKLTHTNAVGDVTSHSYNTNGQVTSITRPTGLTTTNIYDGNGWVTTTIDLEINRTNTFTYTNGLVYTHVNECGLAVTNTRDALNRLTSVRYPDGTTVSNVYTYLDITATKDRLGNWTYRGYNSMRKLVAETNALGNYTRYGYCPCGTLEKITNALGQVTTFYYDYADRRSAVTLPDNTTTAYSYDKIGLLLSETDELNHSTTNYYNNQGLIVAVSNALGRVKAITYDIEDRATNVVVGNGISISITYDNLGRVLTRTYPNSGVETFGYSARGLIAYTNQLNKVTTYGYDTAGRKAAETNANNEVMSYTYDARGNLLTLTDGKNQVTVWHYDEYGRVTNKVNAASIVIFKYKYAAGGHLTNRWTAAKGDTYYAYDAVGNMTNVDYAVSTDIRLQYDALNRLTNMVDSVGTTRYSFSSADRLLSEDGPWDNDTVTFGYYDNGLRASVGLAVSAGQSWSQTYAWDTGNRLTNITSGSGSFGYDYAVGTSSTSSQINRLSLPGGSYITNSYDSVARLLSTELRKSDSTIANRHSYIVNSAGQRTKQTFTDGNYVDYTYDDIGQLKTAIGVEQDTLTQRYHEQFGYAYDAAGNLNSRTNNALIQTFGVNNFNELTNATRSGTLTVAGRVGQASLPVSVTVNTQSASVYNDLTFAKAGFSLTDGTNAFTAIATDNTNASVTNDVSVFLPVTATYSYDSNGNLLSDGHRAFAYDDENQLTSVLVTNVWKSEFVYDGKMRRRIRKEFSWTGSAWNQTNEVRYVYDGKLVIQERASNNVAQVTYTRGHDLSGTLEGAGGIGGLLARSQHSTLNTQPITTHAFYHTDGNGNVTRMINPQQALVAYYHYDPYGNLLASAGQLAEANLHRFSSKELHTPSGLVYFHHRYYEPRLHRWLNRDPHHEVSGANLYRALLNDPISTIDPFGNIPTSPPFIPKPPNPPAVKCPPGYTPQGVIDTGFWITDDNGAPYNAYTAFYDRQGNNCRTTVYRQTCQPKIAVRFNQKSLDCRDAAGDHQLIPLGNPQIDKASVDEYDDCGGDTLIYDSGWYDCSCPQVFT